MLGAGCSQNFQGIVQMCRSKLDDLLEFGQSCFDDRAQLIKAPDLIWIVGNLLPQRLKQSRNVGLRTIVAVEIAGFARQQITTLSRFGFKNTSFKSGNGPKHLVGVFDPVKAGPLQSQIDGQCNGRNDKQP